MSRYLLVAAYVAVAAAANLVTAWFGLLQVGPLLVAAGTFFAGFALCLRDVLQDAGGRWLVLGAIVAGALVSLATGSGWIAIASAVAFLLAEFVDFLVYTPLRARGRWRTAVAVSNTVGAVVDSVVFLSLSGLGLSLAALTGQVLVKAVVVTAVFLVAAGAIRAARRPRVAVA